MDIRRLLSSMAIEVQSLTPLEQYERIAQYACVAVDATESGIMLRGSGGRVHPVDGTSELVAQAHLQQVDCDEGPCLEAIRGSESIYVTEDAEHDPRWPTWGAQAAELGFRSVVSVRLATRDRIFGSLNAYSQDVDAFSASDIEVMEFLGAHASVAISASQTAGQLSIALASRNEIGQAQGLLMAVYDLEPEGAFQYLRRLSQHSNTRLAEVAKQVVAQRHDLR